MSEFRGKSVKAIVCDIADGYVAVNPIFLKGLREEGLKTLYTQISKHSSMVRGEPFPANDTQAIRERNMRLQRLHNAVIVIRHFAKGRRIKLT